MRNVFKYFFILLFLILNSTFAQNQTSIAEVDLNTDKETVNQEIKPYILDCKKTSEGKVCEKKEISTNKILNQNDMIFMGQKIYMDNYNPLNYDFYPSFLNNSFYFK